MIAMPHTTDIPVGFSTFPLQGSLIAQFEEALKLVDPINYAPVGATEWPGPGLRIWCDCDVEVNPCNGDFGVLLREKYPKGVIWELNGVYFLLGEDEGVFFNPPSIIRKSIVRTQPVNN